MLKTIWKDALLACDLRLTIRSIGSRADARSFEKTWETQDGREARLMCMSEENTHHAARSSSASLPEAGESHPCVLLAEDDDEMRRMLASAFRAYGYRVTECTDGFALLEILGTSLFRADSPHYDVVVSDIRMPGLTGLDILKSVHKRDGAPPIILITAFGDEETHTEAERMGVAAVFDKPFRIEHLLDAVRKVTASPSRA